MQHIIKDPITGEVLAIYGSTKEIMLRGGMTFIGTPDLPLQAAFVNAFKDKTLKAHKHIIRDRIPKHKTMEFLYIIEGRIEATIYDNDMEIVTLVNLRGGDYIFTIDGGHKYFIMEEATFIEIKGGPYTGDAADKEKYDL